MSKTQRLRDQLYLLQGSRCFYCDKAIAPDDRTLEHVVPSCDGGLADVNNAVVVCEAANQLLGSASPKQKIIMLKAGGGKIECPKKCGQHHQGHGAAPNGRANSHTNGHANGYAGEGGYLLNGDSGAIHAGRVLNANSEHSNEHAEPLRGAAQQPQKASSNGANGQPHMTAKQKNKARSGHQSMPRPASGGRRR